MPRLNSRLVGVDLSIVVCKRTRGDDVAMVVASPPERTPERCVSQGARGDIQGRGEGGGGGGRGGSYGPENPFSDLMVKNDWRFC